MFRLVAILSVMAVGLAVMADDASAQLLRRRGGCSSGCGSSGGCGVSGGSGCNISSSGSQGCNISAAPQPVRASADDLLQQTSLRKVKIVAPPADVPAPLKINSESALAFCAPVATPKHRLDLERIVYHPLPLKKAPLVAVASR